MNTNIKKNNMNKFESDYKNLLLNILNHGTVTKNRTGVTTTTSFNQVLNINLKDGFPIITGKKIFYNKGMYEYIWFKEGMHTTNYLNEHDIFWWDQYADAKGNLGKVYGYQLRSFNGEYDQLDYVIREINSNSRRAHITLWNPTELNEMALPPCYTGFDFVRINDTLNMSMDFRSSDAFLGLPYDIIVGALFLHEVAKFCELKVGTLGLSLKNVHIYENHIDQVLYYIGLKHNDDLPTLMKGRVLTYYESGPIIKVKLNN